MRASWVLVWGNMYRETILRLINSHLVAVEMIDTMQGKINAMQAELDLLDTAENQSQEKQKMVGCTCLGCGTTIRMSTESAKSSRPLSWRCDSCQARSSLSIP